MFEDKKTDILLIMPPYRLVPPYKYKLIDPPHSLIVLATILKSEGYDLNIFDMSILETGYESIGPYIERVKPKIVGIQNRSTYSFPIVQKTAEAVKKADPSLPVLVGGTHVSYNPEKSLCECENIDYILVGEAEITLPRLLKAVVKGLIDLTEVEGLVYRSKEGTIRRNKDFIPLDDLSRLPLPDLDLIPINRYVERQERYVTHLSRGCLYSCPYCTSEI